ncbi:hypothetical protein PAXRUDRAFT_823179 [Paxillus rubicundulus Ve08.2h10]|uniref:Unplaced genomic scaffold scaffold_49, whole genome shotgun sequence n=1 Tax=Paxillus rubicundulus Ve08.2h10 TaxID=930991 RepID=A0A0D0DVR8_9AGAM|nr:hypothetical protein PAXRUDRAFT_823179 [Paxillus rubicundulus Ve08.2h10]
MGDFLSNDVRRVPFTPTHAYSWVSDQDRTHPPARRLLSVHAQPGPIVELVPNEKARRIDIVIIEIREGRLKFYN